MQNKMKINELKVSDWVLYRGKPAKIITLDEEGITKVKTILDSYHSGYTEEMLSNMRPFAPRCKDCDWFSNFYCKWKLQIARISNKPDSVAKIRKNDFYCNAFEPTYNFIQLWFDGK